MLPKSLLSCCVLLSSCFLHYPIPKIKSPEQPQTKILHESPIDQPNKSGVPPQVSDYFIQNTIRISIEYPSASAGVMCNGNWWVLGDDAQNLLIVTAENDTPYLYQPLPFVREHEEGSMESNRARIKKANKMDFEALAHFQDANRFHHIWAFGSGSKSPWRDTGLYWNFDEFNSFPFHIQPYKINLAPLYEILQHRSQISPEKWNIEGACIDPTGEGALFLLNRTPATLIRIPLRDWFRYLEIGSIPIEKNIEIYTFKLPQIDGYSSGFSGATYDTSRRSIWFSSTVEITNDPISDGRILGSFIGEISVQSGEINGTPLRVPDGALVNQKTKLESLCIQKSKNKFSRKFHGTIDNDNGSSELILIDMHLNNENH